MAEYRLVGNEHVVVGSVDSDYETDSVVALHGVQGPPGAQGPQGEQGAQGLPGGALTSAAADEHVVIYDADSLQLVSVPNLKVDRVNAQLLLPSGTAAKPSLAFGSETGTGFYRVDAGQLGGSIAGVQRLLLSASVLALPSDVVELRMGTASDVRLARDAADALALRRGTNPQGLYIYKTHTSGSDYERLYARWDGNYFKIGTEYAGTGAARSLLIMGSGGFWYSGTIQPWSDSVYDLGYTSLRWRSAYLGGAAANIPLSIKLHASQATNAVEVKSSGDAVLASIDKDGKITAVGGTMTAALTLPNASPTLADHAARKKYVDDQDALAALKSQQIGCEVGHTANQTFATSGAFKKIAFNGEVSDPLGMHDTVTNNSRITVPLAGRYLLTANVSPTTTTNFILSFFKNGAEARRLYYGNGGTPNYMTASIATQLQLAANDYVEVGLYNEVGDVTILGATPPSHVVSFAVYRLGE